MTLRKAYEDDDYIYAIVQYDDQTIETLWLIKEKGVEK